MILIIKSEEGFFLQNEESEDFEVSFNEHYE